MKKIGIILLAVVFVCFSSCKKTENEYSDNLIAEVNGEKLYQSDIDAFLPAGTTAADSVRYADAYIRNWITRSLLYEKAENNVNNAQTAEIEQLVKDYRRSLFIQAYQRRLVERRVQAPSENEVKEYYNSHSETFRLREDLVRGIFMKVPRSAPKLDLVRKMFRKTDENLPEIEKYSYQHAATYRYFMDSWLDKSEISNNIPLKFALKKGLQEFSDEEFVYLLYVEEWRMAGDEMPYDFAKGEIEQILRNRKSMEYLRKFENELYEKALKDGKVVRFDKNEKK